VTKIELPDSQASEIEWHCWCGYIGTLADRDAHRAEHKR